MVSKSAQNRLYSIPRLRFGAVKRCLGWERSGISGNGIAKVKREDSPMAEPPTALDLEQPEVLYSSWGALHYEKSWLVGRFELGLEHFQM